MRAKQFMPFAALKGYEEALKTKEEEVLRASEEKDRINYSEDKEDETDSYFADEDEIK